MEITRETVNQWLVNERRSQSWLAEKCGVSKQAVSNWLRENNPQAISASAQITIRALMEEDAAANRAKPPHSLVLEFDDAEYAVIERAALIAPETVREWAKRTLTDAANEDMESIAIQIRANPPHLAAAAGPGIEAEVVESLDHTIRVRICGLSMDPLLADGQVIAMHSRIASRSPFMKKGLIYLVRIDGAYAVKRFNTRRPTAEEAGEEWAANGRVGLLESINPAFPPITIKSEIDWLAWLDPKELP